MFTEGRSIKGIESKKLGFRKLEKNNDFLITKVNQEITTDLLPENYVYFLDPNKTTHYLQAEAPHFRAISLEPENSISIKNANDVYFEIGLKGIGYLKPQLKDDNDKQNVVFVENDKTDMLRFGKKTYGLVGKRELFSNSGLEDLINDANYYHRLGIRTEIYWAYVKLLKIPIDGKMMTIDELRKNEYITNNKQMHPYIAIRLLKDNHRVEQFKESGDSEMMMIKSFEKINKERLEGNDDLYNYLNINKELKLKNNEDIVIYYKLFALRMVKNLLIMFENHLAHTGLHSSNVTLSGEIVDIGTMQDIDLKNKGEELYYSEKIQGVERAYVKDIRDMCMNLRYLRQGFYKVIEDVKISRSEIYNTVRDYVVVYLKDKKIDNIENYIKILLAFMHIIIVDKNNIPMLKDMDNDFEINKILNYYFETNL